MDTRGIDHLALVCDDMPTAMDFYTRVMGFRLVHVRRVPYEQDRWQPPYDNLRHYFFDMGNDSLFAIFEYPKGLPRQNRDHVGGMQHVAFHVAPEHFDRLVEHVRLRHRGARSVPSADASGRRTRPFGTPRACHRQKRRSRA
jgi:catechol 2,3-dioxygenase-like lactoylglutathione lyase family enzyme